MSIITFVFLKYKSCIRMILTYTYINIYDCNYIKSFVPITPVISYIIYIYVFAYVSNSIQFNEKWYYLQNLSVIKYVTNFVLNCVISYIQFPYKKKKIYTHT